ncbi:MAG TPA: dienelactone hydrolase family protein [Solirubrobacteraceae bacterium]|nr:dienelactone hydrolase family protein [Solirubrobacteraceae bacterium]
MTATQVKPSPEGVPGAVTDPARVAGEDLAFAGAGGVMINGYLARPAPLGAAVERRSARPGMIVIHEAGGLGEHIRDVTNRFANLDYVALGVDLYTREGGPPPAGDVQALMARLFSMSDETVLGDLQGAADYLLARDDVGERIGCIGFCMGGRYALLFATSSERLSAAIDCWGGFIDRATPEQRSTAQRPTPPLELAGELSCPLLAAVGAEDQNPSPALGAQLRERAAASGQEVKVDIYEGAGHAFFADYRPSYRPGPAAELWEQIVPFLRRHLDGGE